MPYKSYAQHNYAPSNTGDWIVFGLNSTTPSINQHDFTGNLDASPFLPSGSTGSAYVGRDLDRDFPTP